MSVLPTFLPSWPIQSGSVTPAWKAGIRRHESPALHSSEKVIACDHL